MINTHKHGRSLTQRPLKYMVGLTTRNMLITSIMIAMSKFWTQIVGKKFDPSLKIPFGWECLFQTQTLLSSKIHLLQCTNDIKWCALIQHNNKQLQLHCNPTSSIQRSLITIHTWDQWLTQNIVCGNMGTYKLYSAHDNHRVATVWFELPIRSSCQNIKHTHQFINSRLKIQDRRQIKNTGNTETKQTTEKKQTMQKTA